MRSRGICFMSVALVLGLIPVATQAAVENVSGSWSETFVIPNGHGQPGNVLAASMSGEDWTIDMPSAILDQVIANPAPGIYVTLYDVKPTDPATVTNADGCTVVTFSNLTLTVTTDKNTTPPSFTVVTNGLDDSGQVALALVGSGSATTIGSTAQSGPLNGTLMLTFSLPDPSNYKVWNVGETRASVRGAIVIDGGMCCDYRFVYFEEGGAHQYSAWRGGRAASDICGEHLLNLARGTKYYASLELRNDAGSVVELDEAWLLDFATPARLTISSEINGSVVEPGEGVFIYDYGVTVPLKAQPRKHCEFTGWSGSAVDAGLVADPGIENTTLTAIGDHTLVANFISIPTLVAHYPFDGDPNDATGNGENGIAHGDAEPVIALMELADANEPIGPLNFGPVYVNGKMGQAISLDGIDDAVEIPTVIAVDWTVALWARANDPTALQGLIAGGDEWSIALDDQDIIFGIKTGVGDEIVSVIHEDAVPDSEWHHVAVTRKAADGAMMVYVDGLTAVMDIPEPGYVADPNDPNAVVPSIIVPAVAYGPTTLLDPDSILLGALGLDPVADADTFLDGDLDEARFYNYVLDAKGVGELASGLTVTAADPEALVAVPQDRGVVQSWEGLGTDALILGTTTEAGPPNPNPNPRVNVAYADDFRLIKYTGSDGQAWVQTYFEQPVSTIYLAERGGNERGVMVALDGEGKERCGAIQFSADDFTKTVYTLHKKPVGTMIIRSQTPIYGIRIYPDLDGYMGMDIANISAVPIDDIDALDGLVACLKFEGDLTDEMGNVVDPALMGGDPIDPNDPNSPTPEFFAPGISGLALTLDGQSQYGDLGAAFGASVLQSLNSFSSSVWVNSDGAGDWPRIYQFGNADNNAYISLMASMDSYGPSFVIKLRGNPDGLGTRLFYNAPDALPVGEWANVVTTLNAASEALTLYIDGAAVLDGDCPRTPSMVSSFNENVLGTGNVAKDGHYFGGALDDLRLYRRALTATEVGMLTVPPVCTACMD